MPVVEVCEQPLGQLDLLPLGPVSRLRLLADPLEAPLDVLAVGDDQLEPERLEIGGRIGVLRETVEDREERVGLPELAGDLCTAGYVDDADRRRSDLLRRRRPRRAGRADRPR